MGYLRPKSGLRKKNVYFGVESKMETKHEFHGESCHTKNLYILIFLCYSSIINHILIGGTKMARGRKSLTLDEQLVKITTEIENMENSLKEMKKAKKDLEDKIKQARLSELDEIISEKGLSFEEVKELLSK